MEREGVLNAYYTQCILEINPLVYGHILQSHSGIDSLTVHFLASLNDIQPTLSLVFCVKHTALDSFAAGTRRPVWGW
jgi:hypothetical protein